MPKVKIGAVKKAVEKTAKAAAKDVKASKSSAKITVKGKAATAEQRKNIVAVLEVCDERKASRNVKVAVVMTITQESVAIVLGHGDKAGPDSRGLYQQRASGWGSLESRMDPKKSTRSFLDAWKRIHGSLQVVPGGYEAAIKKVQVSVGGYQQWKDEAERTVDAVAGGAGGGDGGGETTTTVRKPYAFKVDRGEDYWTAIIRLAEEVQYTAFMRNGTFVYASENYLAAQPLKASITRKSPYLIGEPAFDLDNGKRTQEVSLTLLAGRYSLSPGDPVKLDGFGPADGVWLVAQVERDLFMDLVSVSLKRAEDTLPEPAPETTTRTTGGDSEESDDSGTTGTGADAVYAEARKISNQNLPYAWGGGHPKVGSPSRGAASSKGGPIGTGYDCSGYVAACLAAGGYHYKKGGPGGTSGAMMSIGKPGKGSKFTVWANGNHVFIEFHGREHRYADTSRQAGGPSGPHVRKGTRSTSGFTPRHF